MEHLWAPWRNRYITGEKRDLSQLFVELGASKDDRADHIVYRSKACFVVLNRFPYNAGHMMVVPYRKVKDLEALSDDESLDLWKTTQKMIATLKQAFSPDGMNVGINIGSAGGAGIPQHLHIHIVPRWTGDTNFMTVTDETRVHPSDLDAIYQKITQILQA